MSDSEFLQKYEKMLDRLTLAIEKKELVPVLVSAHGIGHIFAVSVGQYEIQVTEVAGEYRVTLYNDLGDVIDEAKVFSFNTTFKMVKALFDAMRHVVMKRDEAIDALLAELDKAPGVAEKKK